MLEPPSNSFCVLLSVYRNDNPCHFREAIQSILDQSVRPNEIVITIDGPITQELREVIDWAQGIYAVRTVALKENVGRGTALARGIEACSSKYIAIMDADDLCCNSRFEKQIEYLQLNPQISILGGQILEFIDSSDKPVTARKVPTASAEIYKYMRSRNGINQVTVMFSREAVLSVGNYQSMIGFEDYHLWVRAILGGLILENLPDPLVHVRIGEAMFHRRGGLNYVQAEFKFQAFMAKSGFISPFKATLNFILRTAVRLMPNSIRSRIYMQLLRSPSKVMS